MKVDRRSLLGAGSFALSGAALGSGIPVTAMAQGAATQTDAGAVYLYNDAAPVSAPAYAANLARLVAQGEDVDDSYLTGGAVEKLEQAFAALLGKEACAFLPTGSLANHLAVRTLAGDRRRALCLHDSHIYRDEMDSVSTLGEVALRAFAPGRIYPGAAELEAAFELGENGPRPVKVGAVALESPVRRLEGQMVPPAEVARICAVAQARGAGVHLDGARLLLAPPDLDIAAYVAPIDTVYVSLYKYLDAPFGAVLAGSKDTIAEIRKQSEIYGAGIYQGWIAALPALDRLATFREDWTRAWRHGEAFFAALEARGITRREPLGTMGSNDHFLLVGQDRANAIFARATAAGVGLRKWRNGALPIQVNTSILARPVRELARLFVP